MKPATRTTVNTHLEAVWGVQRSSQIWYVFKGEEDKRGKRKDRHGYFLIARDSEVRVIMGEDYVL